MYSIREPIGKILAKVHKTGKLYNKVYILNSHMQLVLGVPETRVPDRSAAVKGRSRKQS